jgi:hypothetical protein
MILGEALWFSDDLSPIQTNKSLIDIDHPINVFLKQQKQYDRFSTYISNSENQLYQINQYIIYTYALEYIDIPKYIPLKLIFQTG